MRALLLCLPLGCGVIPAALAAQEPPEKTGFWRRLWPRQDEVGAAPAAPAAEAPGRSGAPTRRLAVTQDRLRDGRVGKDPTGRRFLDLVDGGAPTAAQLNDFGIWLSGQGMPDAAEEYFRAALALDRGNAEVWNNLGMVQTRLGDAGARGSYQRAIALDPSLALAHYNLGTVLDASGAYDDAIEEFTRALTLDPRLGDPVYNPQVVHNERLLVVRLALYERKTKTLGLPMGADPSKK